MVQAAPVLALLSLPAAARGEADWFASLYSKQGVELRADERVFALFAVLNAMGYDEAPLLREGPVPRREFDPVRVRVRGAVHLEPPLVDRLGAFFDAHPAHARAYARYALSLKGPPGFERTSASGAELEGFEVLLAQAYQEGGLAALFVQAYGEYRAAIRGYLPVIDAPLGALRRLLRLRVGDAPRVVVVVNLLDGRGTSSSAVQGEELVVVIGPSRTPDLFAVAQAVARARLEPLLAARGVKVREGAPPVELLSSALAAAALEPDQSAEGRSTSGPLVRGVELPERELRERAQGPSLRLRELAQAAKALARSDESLDAFVARALGPAGLAPTVSPVRRASHGRSERPP
jgi:hypothetical protein